MVKSIEEQGSLWSQFLGVPQIHFVSCLSYSKVAIEAKHPDYFATKAELLN